MIGWNTFYKDKGKLTGDFLFKGSKDIHTITGYQYRYINTVPIMVMGRYWLTDQNTMFRPYLGLGLGTQLDRTKNRSGTIHATNARWQFAFAPEIGTIIPVNDQFEFNIGAKYTYGTKSGKVEAMQNFTISVGIVFMGN